MKSLYLIPIFLSVIYIFLLNNITQAQSAPRNHTEPYAKKAIFIPKYQSSELLKLSKYLLEIGNFEILIQWLHQQPQHNYTDNTHIPKIIGEAFGFFINLGTSKLWVTDKKTRARLSATELKAADMRIELQAYQR